MAGAIAALLAANTGFSPLAVATELLVLLPVPLLTLPVLAASLTGEVALLVVRDVPKPAGRPNGQLGAYADELVYRAMYGVNALKRLVDAAIGPEEGRQGRIERALSVEPSYFRAHKAAAEQRAKGRVFNDAAAERFGSNVLSWIHTERATTHRPSHEAAHGKNYRVDSPPKATEGMLPGMALHCDCLAGPPIPGAEILS